MRRVSASRFKARLGLYLSEVQAGGEIVVTDRDRPVARLLPFAVAAEPRKPEFIAPRDPAAPALGAVEVRSLPFRGTDSTAMLREDRDRR